MWPILLNTIALGFSLNYLHHDLLSFKIRIARLSSFEITMHRYRWAWASRTMLKKIIVIG